MDYQIASGKFKSISGAFSRLAGFGMSTALAALASLASIPAMVSADGPKAWAAIALGQGIGAISATVVGYGWTISGPSRIALGSVSVQLGEYIDSIRLRLALLFPCAALAGIAAGLISQDYRWYAVTGGVVTTLAGLSGVWYFVGLMKPYVWLRLETLPRVCGTFAGIAFMERGHGALVGLACTAAGMVVGFLLVTRWAYRSALRSGAVKVRRTKLLELLVDRRHGIIPQAGANLFYILPFVVVALVAPTFQPIFALVDRTRLLFSTGLSPFVAFFQGWVARAGPSAIQRRSRIALATTFAIGIAVCASFIVVGPYLMQWMGDGKILVPITLVYLTGLFVAIDLFHSVLAYVAIASMGCLGVVSRATAASVVLMLPLVFFGTLEHQATGAIAGMVIALMIRIVIEIAGISASTRSGDNGA
jgi:hypothetical protein